MNRVFALRDERTAYGTFNVADDDALPLGDRIAVMHGGEIMGIVRPADTDIETLGLMMAGEKRI